MTKRGLAWAWPTPPQPQLNARKLRGTHIKQKKSAQQKLWSQVKIKGELNELCSYIFFFAFALLGQTGKLMQLTAQEEAAKQAKSTIKMQEKEKPAEGKAGKTEVDIKSTRSKEQTK